MLSVQTALHATGARHAPGGGIAINRFIYDHDPLVVISERYDFKATLLPSAMLDQSSINSMLNMLTPNFFR